MLRRTSFVLGVISTVALASAVTRVVVSAQAGAPRDSHGMPVPEKEVSKTFPIKVIAKDYDKKALLSAPVLPRRRVTLTTAKSPRPRITPVWFSFPHGSTSNPSTPGQGHFARPASKNAS